MKTYTQQEFDDAILEARIFENIYWINRAHFMAVKKHEERINDLIKKYKPIDSNTEPVYTESINKG